jgi:hypothetical protein
MRANGACATGFSIFLALIANPADAQGQESATKLQTVPQQQKRLNPPNTSKILLSNRFHQLNSQYGAIRPQTAKYAKSARPALRQLRPKIISTSREIETLRQRIKSKLDSTGEMGDMDSLRLQMEMDRLSKLMSTLSALLKKASETETEIIRNIK